MQGRHRGVRVGMTARHVDAQIRVDSLSATQPQQPSPSLCFCLTICHLACLDLLFVLILQHSFAFQQTSDKRA